MSRRGSSSPCAAHQARRQRQALGTGDHDVERAEHTRQAGRPLGQHPVRPLHAARDRSQCPAVITMMCRERRYRRLPFAGRGDEQSTRPARSGRLRAASRPPVRWPDRKLGIHVIEPAAQCRPGCAARRRTEPRMRRPGCRVPLPRRCLHRAARWKYPALQTPSGSKTRIVAGRLGAASAVIVPGTA